MEGWKDALEGARYKRSTKEDRICKLSKEDGQVIGLFWNLRTQKLLVECYQLTFSA